jgi:hypothetical protein
MQKSIRFGRDDRIFGIIRNGDKGYKPEGGISENLELIFFWGVSIIVIPLSCVAETMNTHSRRADTRLFFLRKNASINQLEGNKAAEGRGVESVMRYDSLLGHVFVSHGCNIVE